MRRSVSQSQVKRFVICGCVPRAWSGINMSIRRATAPSPSSPLESCPHHVTPKCARKMAANTSEALKRRHLIVIKHCGMEWEITRRLLRGSTQLQNALRSSTNHKSHLQFADQSLEYRDKEIDTFDNNLQYFKDNDPFNRPERTNKGPNYEDGTRLRNAYIIA